MNDKNETQDTDKGDVSLLEDLAARCEYAVMVARIAYWTASNMRSALPENKAAEFTRGVDAFWTFQEMSGKMFKKSRHDLQEELLALIKGTLDEETIKTIDRSM